MNEWKVLPTDQRYLDLTQEQRDYLWENYLLEHPELAKKLENTDPDFMKEWQEREIVEGEEKDKQVDSDDEDFSDIEEAYEQFLAERPELEVKRRFDEMMKGEESDEWVEDEEVD